MDKLNQIFNKSTCPGQNEFFRYKGGGMSKKDQYTFEQHLTDCPMCSDFLDGIETFIDQDEFQTTVAAIQKEILSYEFKKKPARKTLFSSINYAIAASVAVLLTFGIWYFAGYHKYSSTSLVKTEALENNIKNKEVTQTEVKTESKVSQSGTKKDQNTVIIHDEPNGTENDNSELIAYEDEAELSPDGNVPLVGYNSVDSVRSPPSEDNATPENTSKTLIGQNPPLHDEETSKKFSAIFPGNNKQKISDGENPIENTPPPIVFNDKVKEQLNKSKLVLADSLFRSNQKREAYLQYRQIDYSYVKAPYHLYNAAQSFYINEDYHPSYFLTERLLSFSHSEFEQRATVLKARILIKTGQIKKAESYLHEISTNSLHKAEVNHLLDSIQSLRKKQ